MSKKISQANGFVIDWVIKVGKAAFDNVVFARIA